MKMADFRTFKVSSDLDLDLGSGHTAYRRASLVDIYLHAKFHENLGKLFVDVRRTIRTYIARAALSEST